MNSTPLARQLLTWYQAHGRQLPWRAPSGGRADPYRVWLSEIMLQQTTVAAVKPYFDAFLRRWPRVEDLAAADQADVLHAWQGLGYYARARNLHACALTITDSFGGQFPDTEEALLRLPGIGRYTAAAIAAIAFGRDATPVDGNVIRVMARMFAITDEMPRYKRRVEDRARQLTPRDRAGDFAQALMDLGATVCLPKSPRCGECPWTDACQARQAGAASAYPKRKPKEARPRRWGVVFWLARPDGAVLMRRRPPRGLLGGMMEFPSTPWRGGPWTRADALTFKPEAVSWQPLDGAIEHIFTHFHLELSILSGLSSRWHGVPGTWCHPEHFSGHALPTVMKKVARHVLGPALA